MKYNKKLYKTYLIYFCVMVLFVGLRICAGFGAFSFIKDTVLQNIVSTSVIQIVIMGLVPISLMMLCFKKGFKQTFVDIGFKKINFKSVCLCLLIGVLVYFLNVVVATAFSFILSIFGYSVGGGVGEKSTTIFSPAVQFIFSTVLVAILPAIFEEITHRGLLMRNIAKEVGYKKAIIISSVFFGLMHLNISQCFYAIFIGVIIGFVSSLSGSIFPAMILHFVNNFINVYFSYAETYKLPGGNLANTISEMFSSNAFLGMLIFLLLTICVCVVLVYLIWQLFKQTRLKEINQSLFNVISSLNENDEQNLDQQKVEYSFKEFVLPFIKNEQDIVSAVLPITKKGESVGTLKTNMFKICSLTLGVIVTIFTLIWGIF